MRERMRKLLENAVDSGSLQAALGKASSPSKIQPSAKCESDVEKAEAMRAKMRGLLEQSMDSGALAEALDKVGKVTTKSGPGVDLDAMRDKMRSMLETAFESGTLQTAMKQVNWSNKNKSKEAG